MTELSVQNTWSLGPSTHRQNMRDLDLVQTANGTVLYGTNGSSGGIVSYSVNGKQYILAATGFGSHAPGFMASAFPEVSGLPGGAALVAFTLED